MHYNFGWYSINPCTLYLFCSSDKTQEDSSVSDQFGDQYFKDFDFLDNETEHIDDEVEDQFNWGGHVIISFAFLRLRIGWS